MSNVTIFKQGGAASPRKELSDLAKSLLSSGGTFRRIQTNTNGTFKRLVNGEQVGTPLRGEINVIIVNALPKVSRVFYKAKYDPNKEATLPDCWSNLGDTPEKAAANKQAVSCAVCPQNITGSGDNGGRACRYQRRVAILVEGDTTGELYQFNIPAKSLFGKGIGNVHPFESYVKFLLANGQSPDTVVTNISYDLNADSLALLFTPMRELTEAEEDLVREAQARSEAKSYTELTVAQTDKVTKLPPPAKPAKVTRSDEPDDDQVAFPPVLEEPVKRTRARAEAPATPVTNEELSSLIGDWSAEDE